MVKYPLSENNVYCSGGITCTRLFICCRYNLADLAYWRWPAAWKWGFISSTQWRGSCQLPVISAVIKFNISNTWYIPLLVFSMLIRYCSMVWYSFPAVRLPVAALSRPWTRSCSKCCRILLSTLSGCWSCFTVSWYRLVILSLSILLSQSASSKSTRRRAMSEYGHALLEKKNDMWAYAPLNLWHILFPKGQPSHFHSLCVQCCLCRSLTCGNRQVVPPLYLESTTISVAF